MSFNEEDVRRFYRWLEHWPTEYTEVRIIGGGASVIRRWVQTEDDFVDLCREWSGKRQCYAGINPRIREGGKAEDVSRVVAVPFDVDSKHPKKEAATDEEVEQAKQRMVELVSWIRVQGYEYPFVAMSGNGYHVIQRVNLAVDDTLPSRLEAYFHEAPTEGMDSVFDLPRILKIPGTMSVKGTPTEERPHRLSHILTGGNTAPDQRLAEHITKLEPYTTPIIVPSKPDAPKKAKRKTSSLKKCFKRFAEEGGRLASDDSSGSDDNLLRLALVTEAHSKGYNRDQIIELFSKSEDFDPKTTKDKVDHQLGKIAVEGIKPWSCLAIYKHGGCLGETCSRYKKHVAKYRPTPPPEPGQPVSPDAFFDGADKFVPKFLVDYIIKTMGERCVLTPRTKKGGDLSWWYNSKTGVFTDNGVSFLKGRINQLLGDRARHHMIREVVELIQIETYIDRKEFEEDLDILVLQNGVYHLDTEELTEYSPQYHAKARWPITYDPDARCPAVLKFLDEVIPGRVEVFLSWLGYHFFKDYRWAVILMLIGDGENGKDILLTLMRTFLGGSSNVSNVKLYDLVTDRFAASRLYGKTANIYSDVGPEELKYTGLLKALTGNSWVGVQEKHFQGFDMRNHAKLSFSTNKMPKTPDSSRAFHRRWLVCNCPNFFVKDATPEMAAQNTFPCDSDIISKITTPTELSGLFNLALEGRRHLLKEGGFDLGSVDERQKIYEELMDPIAAFLDHCVETIDPSGVIQQDNFYAFYFNFCKAKGYTPLLRQTFTKQLKPRIINLKSARIQIGDKREYCWIGISMKPDQAKVICVKCTAYISCVSSKRVSRTSPQPKIKLPKLVQEEQERLKKKESSPPPDPEVVEHSIIGHKLVAASTIDAAIIILKEHDNQMLQQLLWEKLEFYGHKWTQEEGQILRADPRFVFIGMNVSLIEEEKKNNG